MNAMFYLSLIVSLLCNNFLFAQIEAMARAEYFEKYESIAIEEMSKSGVPASILLAQAFIQSESGRHELALAANNHFQTLCTHDWTGDTYRIEVISSQFSMTKCHKKYNTVAASYEDFANKLSRQKKDVNLFSLRPDYKNWAKTIQKMTAPDDTDYTKQIMQVIKKYKLRRYDKLALNTDDNKEIVFEEVSGFEPLPISKKEIVHINRVPAVKTEIGDTPLSIASNYDIPLQKLLEYNDLETSQLSVMEQYIFLQPKRKKRCDSNKLHIVRRHETMYNIAQTNGIRLNTLYNINRMKQGEEPAIGQAIYLCDKRKTPPSKTDQKPILIAPPRLIAPLTRAKTLRRPKIPRVNNGTEIIAPQFIRLSIYSKPSLL